MIITFPKIQFNSSIPRIIKKRNSLNNYASNPIYFEGHRCSEKGFKIKEIKNLHCPVCGYIMIDKEQANAFITDVSPKKGKELCSALDKYSDEKFLKGNQKSKRHRSIYQPLEQNVVNIIKNTAVKYPDLSLFGIIKYLGDEIIEKMYSSQINELAEFKKYIINSKDTQENKAVLLNIIRIYKKKIEYNKYNTLKGKYFIHDIAKNLSDTNSKDEITNKLNTFPLCNNNELFIVKLACDAKNSEDVARKLIESSKPTAEHLYPKSKGGYYNFNNLICDCARCNNTRLDMPFAKWIQHKKGYIKNFYGYIYEVQEAINKGLLPEEYNNYTEDIIKTLNRISLGKLILTSSKENIQS